MLAASDPDRRSLVQPRLVEREWELGALAGLLNAARGGDGRGLLLEGAAGVGKSALLAVAGERARDAGMLVLDARGGELECGFGFGVVRQLFERMLTSVSGSRRRSLLSGAARFALPAIELAAAPDRGDAAGPDPFSVMHGLYWLTVNLSAAHPVLVCVDDAHWADLSSLRWLVYLARRLDGVRAALLVAGRSAEPDDGPVGAALAALRAEPVVDMLRPAALSVPAVGMLAGAYGSGEPAQAFVRACHELTAGNPFLVGELLRAIAAEGLPLDAAGVAQLRRLAPKGVAAAVQLRLSRLQGEATAVARAVAVLEPHAELRYVSELAGLDEATCVTWVDALASMEILGPGRPLSFVHPLIRAAIEAHRGVAERAAAHKRAARVLARAGAGVELVAPHLAEGEPAGDGWVVEMLMSAASRAMARGAPTAALAHLRRALEEPPDQRQRLRVLLALGRAGFAAQQPDCVGYLREAMTTGAVPAERATAAVQLGLVLIMAGQAGAQLLRRDFGQAQPVMNTSKPSYQAHGCTGQRQQVLLCGTRVLRFHAPVLLEVELCKRAGNTVWVMPATSKLTRPGSFQVLQRWPRS